MISIFIVEDEAPAREELAFLLEEIPEINVVGMARNGKEALIRIPLLKPQVVFLDIQMPDMSGITVARELLHMDMTNFPILIFATAFDQYALEAFEVNAIDYLLKPFNQERLVKTMERVKFNVGRKVDKEKEKLEMILTLLEKPFNKSKLPVEVDGRIILLDQDEIVFAGISGRQTLIKTVENQYLSGYSLNELETKFNLLRTHKSYLVNRDMVREIIPWFNGTFNLVMKDKQKSTVPVSRTFVKALRAAFNV